MALKTYKRRRRGRNPVHFLAGFIPPGVVPSEDNTTNRLNRLNGLNSLREEVDGDKKGGREASAAAIAQAVGQLVHLAG